MNALMEVPTVEQNPDIPYLGKLLGDAIREHDCDVLSIAPKLYGPRRSIDHHWKRNGLAGYEWQSGAKLRQQ